MIRKRGMKVYKGAEARYNVSACQLRVGVTTICNIERSWVPSKVDTLSLVTVLLDCKVSKSGLHASAQLKQFLESIYERDELNDLSVNAWCNDGNSKHILDVLADLMEQDNNLKKKNKEKEFWWYLNRRCGHEFAKVYSALKNNYELLVEVRSSTIVNKGEEKK